MNSKKTPSISKEEYEEITKVPKYGLKVKLDHEYPEKRTQNYTPSFKIVWSMFPLILRYLWYYIKSKLLGRSVVMDYMDVLEAKQIYGVPLGGIGAGTIGRGFRGEFCRFQVFPGIYQYYSVDADQFIITIKDENGDTILQSLLSCYPTKKLKSWQSLIDPSKCSYTGLYPRAWTEYDLSEWGIMLKCRQVSPVIPHNYKDSSLPCAVFVWEIENVANEKRTVTIAFTFKNGTGESSDDRLAHTSSSDFTYHNVEGVILFNTIRQIENCYVISVNHRPGIKISKCVYFDPNSDGVEPWMQLKNNGCFGPVDEEFKTIELTGEIGIGIAAQVTIAPSRKRTVEMSLVWNMPVIRFPNRFGKFHRYYTKFFGVSYDAATLVTEYAYEHYMEWEKAIYNWQKPILEDLKLPDWYKTALFNETYYVSDGGSVWIELEEEELEQLPRGDIRKKVGKFAYLEGHEYRMFNTYDVHFYASFALVCNWPLLQKTLQYDMKDAIYLEIPKYVWMLYDGAEVYRKVKNTVPHDIGDPGEEPFYLVNAYPIHDVSMWRDLNVKFVLQVFRDAFINKLDDASLKYLTDMYDTCCIVMEKTLKFDIDNDGLIENSGAPDQTFDTWIMKGSSAYCGGLWLAALFAMTKIADALEQKEDKAKYQNLLERGRKAFQKKLWNGQYYNFDCSEHERRSIMADQLCGHWYLRATGFNYEVFPQDCVLSSLKSIYENNVLSFCDGKMGAVNGFIDGEVDTFTLQSLEVWTGVTYALASSMIQEGLWDEAFATAGGMFKSMTDNFGMAFQTPEALYATKYYRAVGYMRPLSIWSMQLAIEQQKKENVIAASA